MEENNSPKKEGILHYEAKDGHMYFFCENRMMMVKISLITFENLVQDYVDQTGRQFVKQ